MKLLSTKLTTFLACAFFILTCCISCQSVINQKDNSHNAQDVKEASTSSGNANSYSKYYAFPELENGNTQSPINILSNETDEGKHNLTFNFKDEINKVENLGHTIQLDFEPGSTITTHDGKTFESKQIHFHTPSEHLIDGVTYPMEMHIVNTRIDEETGAEPEYLVLSFLFKMGEKSQFIDEFLNQVPAQEQHDTVVPIGTIRLMDLIHDSPEKKIEHCYHYKGSLTTPNYAENVYWYVSKEIFMASPDQIFTINKIEGNNARHIQALYGRHVNSM